MRRLSILLGALAAVVAVSLPTAAVAHASVDALASGAVSASSSRDPAATPAPQPSSSGGVQQPVAPASGGSTTATDALTIVGFAVVAMAGLIFLLRAGLRSAGAEDDD